MIDSLSSWAAADVALVVLKTTLLLVATWLVSVVARRRSAAERHFIWLAGILGAGLLPLMTALPWRWDVPLPAAPVPMFDVSFGPAPATSTPPAPALFQAETIHRDSREIPEGAADSAPPPLPSMAPSVALPGDGGAAGSLTAPALLEPSRIGAATTAGSSPVGSGGDYLLMIWALIATVLVVRLAVGHLQAFRYRRSAASIGDPALIAMCRRIEGELGTGPIRMVEGAINEMPKAGGVLRPWLVLPSDVAGWPLTRQDSVLRHEIAHVSRRDNLWEVVVRFVCALHWFNPLVWFAAARLRGEREHACDDIVLLAGTSPSDYASALLSVARQFRSGLDSGATAVAMAKPSRLRSRLTAVLGERRRTREAFGGRGGLIAAGGLPLLLLIGAVSPVTEVEAIQVGGAHSVESNRSAESGRPNLPEELALTKIQTIADASAEVEPSETVVPIVASEAEPGVTADSTATVSMEPGFGVVFASAGQSVSRATTLVSLERAFAQAAAVRYQVTATLQRSDETAPMVPARIVAALQANAFLERMNVGWGGSGREPQMLSVSFSFPDSAAFEAWRESEAGRAFEAAVAEAAVAGTVRSTSANQPVH